MSGSYHYKRKKESEIEDIASDILNRFPARLSGKILNIEGLIEDYGIQVLARQHLRYPVAGYLAKDPRIIVISEEAYKYLPNLRHTLSEELSHVLLEFGIYKKKKFPEGAACHELTTKEHKDIEDNADMLASALLLPKQIFLAEWTKQRAIFTDGKRPPAIFLRNSLDGIAKEFNVLPYTVYRRARDLHQITHKEYTQLNVIEF